MIQSLIVYAIVAAAATWTLGRPLVNRIAKARASKTAGNCGHDCGCGD